MDRGWTAIVGWAIIVGMASMVISLIIQSDEWFYRAATVAGVFSLTGIFDELFRLNERKEQ